MEAGSNSDERSKKVMVIKIQRFLPEGRGEGLQTAD